MLDGAASVRTAHITYAARDSVFDDTEIKEGQLLGLTETKVTLVADDMLSAATGLVKPMIDENTGFISLYYGEGVTADEAEEIRTAIAALAPEAEVVAIEGGQPVYHYIISVE